MPTSLPIKGDADKKIGAFNAPLSVSAQDAPNMTVKVRAGSFFNSQNVLTEFVGGNTAQIAAPLSAAKWVIVGLNDAGSLTLTHGTNQASPTLPAVPAGTLALAAVYLTSTTTSITPAMVQDIRPFLRSIDNVPNVASELANRPTFTDVANDLVLKADVDGTPDLTFTLNKDNTTGSPGTDAYLSVARGNAATVAIRWNESIDQWEFTNDGINYGQFASTSGTYAPLVHTHVHTDITDFTSSVNDLIAIAAIDQTQVTGLATALAAKANLTAFNAHANDTSIHHTLPLAQSDITNLVSDLASKASTSGASFTGTVTVQAVGNQPISLVSVDSGSSGLQVVRANPNPTAKLEWDESAGQWMAGTVGSMNAILTGDVAVQSVNGQTGVVALTATDVGAAPTVHTHTASAITDFNTAADARIAAATIAQSQVTNLVSDLAGKAAVVHTHVAADVTDFTSAVNALIPVTSVNGDTGAVVLSYTDVGAAPTVHTHVAADVTDFNSAADSRADGRIAVATIAQSQVTNLVSDLAGKAPTVHTHTASAITDFNSATDARIAAATIAQSQVTNLVSDLAGKAAVVHTHVAADVTDFTSAVNALIPVTSVNGDTGAVVLTNVDVGAAATVHTHVAADITDFNTAADARIAAAAPPTGTVTTNDATPTQIYSAAGPASNSAVTVEVFASGFEVATGDATGVRVFATVKNVGGTISALTNSVDVSGDAGAAAWTVAVTASGANFNVVVTGEAAKTIAWKAKIVVA